jgi:PAS domain S-box-containing protein
LAGTDGGSILAREPAVKGETTIGKPIAEADLPSLSDFAIMSWRLDLAAKVLDCGDGDAEFYGRARQRTLQSLDQFVAFIHPDDRASALAAMRPAWEGKQDSWNVSFRILGPGGKVRRINSRARLDREERVMKGVDIDNGPASPGNLSLAPVLEPAIWLVNALATSKVGVAILDGDLRYLALNQALADMNGLPAADHVGRRVSEILGSPSGNEVELILGNVLAKGSNVVDFPLTAEIDGKTHNFVAQYFPLKDQSSDMIAGICCLVADITEFANSQTELASANALLDTIFEEAPIGLAVWDRSLRFVRVNRQLAEMNGVSPDLHVGKMPIELLPDIEGLADVQQRWLEIMETGTPWLNVEITGATPAAPGIPRSWNENFFPIRVGEEVVGLGAIVEETTERKKIETALKDSEAKAQYLNRSLHIALSAASANAFVWDIGNDRTWRLSSGALQLPPEKRTACFGELLNDVHPADVARFRENVDSALEHPDGVYNSEFRLVRSDGIVRWVSEWGQVERSEDGTPKRLVGISMDVTERKQHEEKIQLLMREVSHRSKNLLAVVQAVANRTASTGNVVEFPERFGERLRGMSASHDLLVLSNWEGVDLNDLVRSQLSHFEDLVDERITLKGPVVRCNASAAQAIGMALHELATNAGKYGALSNDSGKVQISWSMRTGEDGPRFHLAWEERGGPHVTPPKIRGFGHTVMVQMAEASLGGSALLSYDPLGLVWRIDAPAENVLED